MGVLVEKFPTGLIIMKYLGAAYLIYFGFMMPAIEGHFSVKQVALDDMNDASFYRVGVLLRFDRIEEAYPLARIFSDGLPSWILPQ